jgi:hypothetical protein
MQGEAAQMVDVGTVLVALLGSSVIAALVSHRGELARAREERRQTRLAKTYFEVIELTLRVSAWVERTVPALAWNTDPGPPDLPTEDEQRKVVARISAYGSPQMQDAFKAVAGAQRAFVDALRARDTMLSSSALTKAAEASGGLESTFVAFDQVRRNRVRPAVQALLDLANAELAERHASWWSRFRGAGHRPR